MNTIRKSSMQITTLIVVFPLIVLLLYGILSHMFFFFSQHKEAQSEILKYEKTLMDAEKNNLKEKVENLVQFIEYYHGRSSEKIKEDVKNIVNVTANIANNLYAQYYNKMQENDLKELIRNALRKIKFERDIGYLFLLDLEGNALIHVDKEIEGKNILHIQDVTGKYILKEFNKVLQRDGEGFVDYYWYIASENKKEMHYKISFVKMLNAYNWYIGAGEYLKYMGKFLKEDILKYIEVNANFKHGYFLLNDSNNTIIFHPLNKSSLNITTYKKEGFSQNKIYLSYTQYLPQYNWYLTANKNLAEINANIQTKKINSNIKESLNTKINLKILLFTWFISLLLSIYLSMIINRMLKSYEEKLHHANEKLVFQSRQALIGELFSMIAHQWRQPINKIASILALLRFKIPQEDISYKQIDKKCLQIEESIEFMSETIDDFRTFYQPKNKSEIISLTQLIKKSINFIEGHIRKKSIKLTMELESIELDIYANEFLQVMINIIKNAVDSVGHQGEILIKLYKKESQIIISVKDNGEGITKNAISKVFDPYYTTKKDSMGLGLYMTKIIVEKHMNGTIEVIRLKKGSLFIIYLKVLKT